VKERDVQSIDMGLYYGMKRAVAGLGLTRVITTLLEIQDHPCGCVLHHETNSNRKQRSTFQEA
jgi:hypothetical protein